MTSKNAVKIGKGLGSLLEVDNGNALGHICRQYLRIKVELDTLQPLVPGFQLSRIDKAQLWVSFKYERLVDYCTMCGLIGHKKFSCPTLPPPTPIFNYGISLKVSFFTSPRIVTVAVFEDSDSSISSARSVLAHSTTYAGGSNGDESTYMQLVALNSRVEQMKSDPLIIKASFRHAALSQRMEANLASPAMKTSQPTTCPILDTSTPPS